MKVFGVIQGSSKGWGGRDDDRRCFGHASRAQPSRARNLLEHFSQIRDTRQPCKVMYPLGEMLLLVVCGTMAACDNCDDIVLWGNRHLPFLRGLQEDHHGIPAPIGCGS
jgi:hypothetical protein